jgi:hypothetical protein
MPITRIMPEVDHDNDIGLDVFQVQEAVEVYDGALALAVDHLFNHIKALISISYLPGSQDLEQALARHPILRRMKKDQAFPLEANGGRSADRILLSECQRLLEGLLYIAHLSAWPETSQQATQELVRLQKEIPFLDYRYDNDPFPSDKDHEE